MPCTKDFTKETLLGRSKLEKENLRQSGELARFKIAFSALNILLNLTRSASTYGDFAGNNRANEDKKTEKGIALLV